MEEDLSGLYEQNPHIAKAHDYMRQFNEDELLKDAALRRESWLFDQRRFEQHAKEAEEMTIRAEEKAAHFQSELARVQEKIALAQEEAVRNTEETLHRERQLRADRLRAKGFSEEMIQGLLQP